MKNTNHRAALLHWFAVASLVVLIVVIVVKSWEGFPVDWFHHLYFTRGAGEVGS